MISTTEKESALTADSSAPAPKEQRLTVTGLDEKGQMFRESAPVLDLNGRDCHFRSKFQPELGSWVLVEFDSSKTGSKRVTVQGQVKSAHPDGLAGNLFRIYIELETAQELKIVSAPQPPKPAAPSVQPPPHAAQPLPVAAQQAPPVVHPPPAVVQPSPVAAPRAEAFSVPKEMHMEPIPVRAEIGGTENIPLEVAPVKAAAPVGRELFAPKPQAEPAAVSREASSVSVAQEVKQQLAALKDSIRGELEGIAQRVVTSTMEPAIRQTVEKQIATNYQASIETLNSDLTFQLAGRLSNNEELRASVAGMAKKAIEEQWGQLRNSAIEEQRASKANLDEFTRSFEKSIAEIELRLKAADAAANASEERARAIDREIAESAERLLKVADQMNHAARTTIEKFDAHVTAQLNSWSAQFKNHVDGISREKAATFTSVLEQQLSSQLQESNEVLEKLSAGLQLARGTVRAQESLLVDRSRGLAAEFENELKAVLARLAGTI